MERKNGYTLMELIVVILIIGIALSVVLPKLDGLVPEFRIKSAARKIASTVQLARSQAISTGRTYHVVYSLSDDAYWLLAPPPLDEDGSSWGEPKPEVLFYEKLPEGVKLHEVDVEEEFRGKGEPGATEIKISASPLGLVTPHSVFLKDGDGRQFTVTVNPVTGVSEICDRFEKKTFIEEELFK